MTTSQRDVRLSDNRVLSVQEEGQRDGLPVFVLHGSPGSRLISPGHVEDATRKGIRLIGHDRPGYGGSSPKPNRCIADEAGDVAAIADALGIDRFAVWGYSGGGAPVLACAAELPDRVVAAASIAAFAPYPSEGLDWFEGMGESNVVDIRLMLSDRPAWEAKLAEDGPAMKNALKNATDEQLLAVYSAMLCEADRAILTKEEVRFYRAQISEGQSKGTEGTRDDNLSWVKPWGFELSAIRVSLQLWHGGQDRFVPFAHGKWLASHLPLAEPHLEPKDGHGSLLTRGVPMIHDWLVAHF